MKILHTEASCGWGGQEIRILSEASGLIERGHDVSLICPAESKIFSEAPRFGVPVMALPIGRKNLKGLTSMYRYLQQHHFDVINTHSSTDAWLVALASRFISGAPPMVRTRHISAPISKNMATRWLYGSATRCIATTGEALREELLTRLPIRPEDIVSVPTGVDTERYRSPGETQRANCRASLGLPSDVFLIGIVATLRSWKGHRFLLEALANFPENIHLAIVGDGPQFEALKQQISQLGLQNKVTLAGNQTDVVPWLQAFDVFALPSYANEGVPQALMQAMACGLPCVTTNAGAISELARHGETALVVPKQDAVALGAALLALVYDIDLRLRLGEAARRHVVMCYGKKMMLDRMERLFSQACASGGQ